MVLKRLGGPPATNWMEPLQVENILKELFPTDSAEYHKKSVFTARDDNLALNTDEVSKAVERVCSNSKKALGKDMIINSVWGMIHQAKPSFLQRTSHRCIPNALKEDQACPH